MIKKSKSKNRFQNNLLLEQNWKSRGFTMIEVIVIIVMFSVLSLIVITNFALQKQKTDLKSNVQDVVSILRLAQSKTLASTDSNQYGVYFDDLALPNSYVLFKGESYASRDPSFDVAYVLLATMEFSSISFSGGNEVVFDKLTGTTSQAGSLDVRMKLDISQSETIFISNSGSIDFSAPVAPSDTNRVKDSRHAHFDYNRANFVNCPTTDATLSLYFDGAGTPQQIISICSNLVSEKLEWQGTVSVAGSNQTVEIDTHYLQDAGYPNGTQFSVHRDGRLNTKSLRITISGDISGDLINYSANGLTTTYTSIYVSNLSWQ